MISLRKLSGNASSADATISGISFDSRAIQPGEVFFALRGTVSDGHDHLIDVVKKNPAAIVVEDRARLPDTYKGPVFVVANARRELAAWAARFFGDPSEKLFSIAVTGTNGKTTTVYMLESIFNAAGRPTGVLGTIDHHFKDRVWQTALTTPDAITLQERLKEFVDLGATTVAFEVSSIAIDQDRASSIAFDAAIFTNFTRDHLDYHGSMEKYFFAKQALFDRILPISPKAAFAVLNGDDQSVRKLTPATRALWFGQHGGDYQFTIHSQDLAGSRFHVKDCEFYLATPGVHNVYNAVGALAVALEAGVSPAIAQQALANFHGAPGRLEAVPNKRGLHVFVDYAHSDDALRSVLISLRSLMVAAKSKGQLWVVFGCGGDRDKGKRPLMMKAALAESDHVVLTSDNPRTEDPQTILNDCLKGGISPNTHVEVDRKLAIRFALQTAKEGDVILLAGKGHENYQIIGQTKYPFSDVDVIKENL